MTVPLTGTSQTPIRVPQYTKAGLPTAGTDGLLARVTDNQRGLWVDDGSEWYPVAGKQVNVLEFGAAGDGVTDDHAALASAMSYAAAIGGVCVLPATANGYAVTSQVSVTLTSGQHLVLRGLGQLKIVSTLSEPGAEAGVLQITGTSTSRVTIEGLTIQHNASVIGLRDGIYLAGPFARVHLRDVVATGASLWGIRVDQASGTIVNCEATGNYDGGLGISGCNGLKVIGGTYSNNGYAGGAADYGVALVSSANLNKNITIDGVLAENNYRKGIDVHNGYNIKIVNNHVTIGSALNATPAGIYAVNQGGPNAVYHNGAAVAAQKGVRDILISGNTIDGSSADNSVAVLGIQIGANEDQTVEPDESGTFIVVNNEIRLRPKSGSSNDNNANSSAISVDLPANSDGVTPDKLIICNNTIKDGAGGSKGMVTTPGGTQPTPYAVVSGNILHSYTANIPINLQAITNIVANDNLVIVDSGTVADGIYLGANKAVARGNQFLGSATYTTKVYQASFSTQLVHDNLAAGALLTDDLVRFFGATSGKKVQTGTVSITVTSGQTEGTGAITFPVAYNNAPNVFFSVNESGGLSTSELPVSVYSYGLSASAASVAVNFHTTVGADRTVTVAWLAFGT